MKTSVKIAIGVAVALAIAYPVSMPLAGKYLESKATEMTGRIENEMLKKLGMPYTLEQNFVREGFSNSTYTLTVVLEIPQKDGKTLKLKLNNVSHIKHGLFTGGVFGIGASDDEFTLEEAPEEIIALLGDNKTLKYNTLYTLSEAVSTFDVSKKFDINLDGIHIVLDGISGKSLLSYDLKRSSYDFRYANFSAENEDVKLTSNDGVLISLQTQIPDGDNENPCTYMTCLYSGKTKITAANFSVEEPNSDTQGTEKNNGLFIRKFTLDFDISDNRDFLDILSRVGAESWLINGVEFAPTNAPAHFDISFRHLQKDALTKFYRAYAEASLQMSHTMLGNKPNNQLGSYKSLFGQIAPVAIESGLTMLEKSPEIRIDRLYFMTPKGVVDLSASVSVKDLERKNVGNLDIVLDKLEMSLDAAVPVALVNEKEDLAEQIKFGKKEGFLTEKDNILSTKVKLKNNELTINGKPSPVPFSVLRAKLKGSEGPSLDDILGNKTQ
jgi:uncharacterized protein YdgA (DUF945 family)